MSDLLLKHLLKTSTKTKLFKNLKLYCEGYTLLITFPLP